ncbi:outer membrane receptor protein involved in Fe transport [Epilithonimonas arachidiradicis]|uniref:Outer membrane receptor protein involved in Fe transport n=2 Tax=Epilithonimonas arachidiradicis TaxID=1617282 RepID=A0A420D7A4_9FLAO|nr:outer membrane receptor protein involved in Fe transport [Epilithonimonas arachidiradicis]GGG63010.1 TonB-dependent receptor [Epilithonimonas arachidiradicis]
MFTKLLIFGAMNTAAFMFSQSTINDTISRDKTIDEVVITGNSNPKASIKTSTSISTLKMKDIENAAPRTTAEIFRTIPGIRSESSGGEGNSNITVRGVPVSAGGSRYLLIQEDGLPVMQFGDIAFGTQDQFTRFDSFVSRVEALRGGSASVFASNSPAGIINFITKTGEKEGGSITQQMGLNYKNYRTDFDYGTKIGDDTYMAVGGFYRIGDGPRKTGFNSNNGGQFRVSLLKKFEKGSFRVYAKVLDDRTAAYMPMPVGVTGTDSDPKWSSLPNYNILTGALQTIHLQHDRTLGNDGNIFNTDVSDGMHSMSKVIGAEFNYNLGEGWKFEEKIRYAANDGQFVAPFPASVSKGSDFFNATNFANFGSAVYAGTNTPIDMNANYMKIALFNVKLNNFNNFVNDFNISKKWDIVKFNAGLYKSSQNINMSWMWNNYLQEVSDKNARLIDVKTTSGQYITDNGLLNYGMKDWGNLKRDYNTKYDITAPHAQVEINATEKLTIDAGARYDIGKVSGYFSGATVTYTSLDMNGNGVIDTPEQMVGSNDNINVPVNYRYGIFGYSVGANYALSNKNAVFARVSQGGSASADRILFSGYNYTNNDDPALDAVKVNKVNQVEAGYKLRGSGYFLNTTFFYAGTKEANYEATTQRKTENKYQSFGVELDGYYKITQGLDIKAGLTYTHAEIKNAIDPTIIGNMPRRTPKLMYSVNPNFNVSKFNVGFYLIGATKAFTQDNNKLLMPGYAIVNPYVSYQVLKNLSVSLNANNVFNTIAVTEAEEGSIAGGNGIVRARTLPGASYSVSVKFDL